MRFDAATLLAQRPVLLSRDALPVALQSPCG
jgi:hypothetical protein